MANDAEMNQRPRDVGVLAMEVYFPATFVRQEELEQYDGVSAGKYTVGLGQDAMTFTGDREDINSIALTCVAQLMEKYQVDPQEIGRLEVGTETLVDKSKSTKTVLMSLFQASGNVNVEGVTTVNACYGGTAALFNALAWVESSAWDGRYAIVVAADIAVYPRGPARPTGGCGAIAMLIGPNAPLVVDSSTRTTHATHFWDFYKPNPHEEYPTVDGRYSQSCYLQALDDCYERFCMKQCTQKGLSAFDMTHVDHAVFHSPYNKLVQKSFARLLFMDARRDPSNPKWSKLEKWMLTPLEDTLNDRELDLATRSLAKESYSRMVNPGCSASKQLGNCYTASVYINLATLVNKYGEDLAEKDVVVFSYGSGSMASMFAVRGRSVANDERSNRFSLGTMANCLDLLARLKNRLEKTPVEYAQYMIMREQFHGVKAVKPHQPITDLFPGTFYLDQIDDKYQRTYSRKPKTSALTSVDARVDVSSVASSGVVISGMSAIMPGSVGASDNHTHLEHLLKGTNCIQPIARDQQHALLARNIIASRKGEAGSRKLEHPEECIQVASMASPVDLAIDYGVPATIAKSMDNQTRLAVAAGLEALKNASLVDQATNQWQLPSDLQDRVGVLFATSFPTVEAATAEVERYHTEKDYVFDRKYLFRLLVLANAQLAQITGARGPNAQVNSACSGSTQAIGMAQDWIRLGKCDAVLVVACDTVTSSTLLPWIGAGFQSLGAASTASSVEDAALPFDVRRNGLVLGSGASAFVVEAASFGSRVPRSMSLPQVKLVASQFSNAAYHGASLDVDRLTSELRRFFQHVEKDSGISIGEFVAHGVYYSHETFTNASPSTSCAYAEIKALRGVLGEKLLPMLMICNTKGFTGHAMAVSFEDLAAVEGLRRQCIPPVVNFKELDPQLGDRLNLSKGGHHAHKYALRFAAGFGSQLAFTLYAL